jgi:DNA-binding transcriptional LysR family regulator
MTVTEVGDRQMKQPTEGDQSPGSRRETPSGVELRHLRYLVAVADAGTFTHAAERMFVAQPTLSQQIRRLEEIVGTPLLDRRRDGVGLTAAGRVLLEESRTVLSLLEHGVRRSRQAAGLGRLRLRFAVPPSLPGRLVADVAIRLRSVAAAAGIDVTWLEGSRDAGFTQVRLRQADSALGWLMPDPALLPDSLDAMALGEFEPEVWVPAAVVADRQHVIGLDELASIDVVHGSRRASPATYDAWLTAFRTIRPRFEFTDPPSRHSLPVTLAFAATAERPTAVLTGPLHAAGDETGDSRQQPEGIFDMVRVRVDNSPLSATAAVIWSGDLPRVLQQVLFDTADATAATLAAQATPGPGYTLVPCFSPKLRLV